jgi:hypothetical protein
MNTIKKLRNLISTTLDVDSRAIELQSESLNKDWKSSDCYSIYGNAFEITSDVRIYAIEVVSTEVSQDLEIRKLELPSNSINYQNADGTWVTSNCCTFDDLIRQMKDNDNFIVTFVNYYGWQQGSEDFDELDINVYLSPSKNKYLSEMDEEENERWNKWFESLFDKP